MRLFFTLLISGLFLSTIQAQEIKWMTMNEALEAQKEAPKKIFMDAYTIWCGPCKMLDRNTFTNKNVIEYVNKNFYPVKFNAEGTQEIVYKDNTFSNPNFDPERKGRNSQHQFATAMKISGYPSLVFFDEEGEMIAPIAGYRTPRQLEMYLKMFASDDYKALTTKEAFLDYQEEFEGTFKD